MATALDRAGTGGERRSYGDPDSLRDALAQLHDSDRYPQMCRNAHQAFLEAYNWDDVMAPRLLSLYRRLLGP